MKRSTGFVIPPGAKSLGINLDAIRAVVPAVDRLPHGSVVCRFEVKERPVPWSVPFVAGNGGAIKDPRLVAWQGVVAFHAGRAMEGRPPYPHPVRVMFNFRLASAPNGSIPDLTNLVKATEDALQGTAIVNDRQVFAQYPMRIFGRGDGATIEVSAIDPMGGDTP